MAKKQNSLAKHPGGRPTKPFLDNYPSLLIQHMSAGYSFQSFGALIPCASELLYKWLDQYPEFSKAKKEGEDACRYYWEQAGKKGMTGQIPGFNATVWIFNMKNRFHWRDVIDLNSKSQHTNVNVNVNVEGKVSELLEEFTKLLDVKKEAVQIKDVTPRRIKSS